MSAVIAVTNAPASDRPCDVCPTPFKGLDLMTAGRHPRLRGTQWLRSRKLGKLRVCRRCERLWTEHFDTREHYIWHRDLGHGGLELLAEDSTPQRILAWCAGELERDAAYWPAVALDELLRRRPEQLQATLEAISATLAAPVDDPGERAALRREVILRLSLSVARRAVARVLRPSDWTRPSPLQASAAAVRELCRQGPDPRREGDVVYAGRSAGLLRQRALDAAWLKTAPTDGGLVHIADATPLVQAMRPLRHPEEPGHRVGERRHLAWQTLVEWRDLARNPENRHAISAAPAAWTTLAQALDPVATLRPCLEELLAGLDAPPRERLDAIQCAEAFLPVLGDAGARLAPPVLERLRETLEILKASKVHPDRVARPELQRLLRQFERQADFDCTSIGGHCAEGLSD